MGLIVLGIITSKYIGMATTIGKIETKSITFNIYIYIYIYIDR